MKPKKTNLGSGARVYHHAQATIEFVSLIGFLFLLFLVFAVLLEVRTVQVSQRNDQIQMKQIADIVVTEANLAESTGDGYSRVFELPNTLNGMDYNITVIEQQDLILIYNMQEYVYFLSQKVFGQPQKGRNLITNIGTLINITGVS